MWNHLTLRGSVVKNDYKLHSGPHHLPIYLLKSKGNLKTITISTSAALVLCS